MVSVPQVTIAKCRYKRDGLGNKSPQSFRDSRAAPGPSRDPGEALGSNTGGKVLAKPGSVSLSVPGAVQQQSSQIRSPIKH